MAGRDDLHLPLEIWREILIRLPVKSILRCRSVCKSWYSLISCPNFISDHSARNLNKNGNRVLLRLYCFPFSSHDKSFMESREQGHDEIPNSFLGGSIVGSCNGLICLMNFRHTDDVQALNFLIWNPTIRKTVELPSTNVRSYSWFGFGFDSKTSDYKVLSCSYLYENPPYLNFQIFDLKKGVWRDISPRDPDLLWDTEYCGSADCYLNGAVHWSGGAILLSFNFSDECFREINMPNRAEFIRSVHDGDSKLSNKSVTFGGLIHLIVFTVQQKSYIDMSKSCSVWAMKEYGVAESWTKLFDIALQSDIIGPSTKLRSLPLLWEKGEVLMMHNLHDDNDEDAELKQGLVLHNAGGRRYECIFSTSERIWDLCLYEESLDLM